MKVYCLSYNNREKYDRMKTIFTRLSIPYSMYEGVPPTDERLRDITGHEQIILSCMYGHLDMLKQFYNESENDNEYGIFCEDDIHIHHDFMNIIPKVIEYSRNKMLGTILLCYLITNNMRMTIFDLKSTEHVYGKYNSFQYGDDLWGAQMYMLSRKKVGEILSQYSNKC